MLKNIKKKLEEIIEVVKICPPNLQEKCFEILLEAELKNLQSVGSQNGDDGVVDNEGDDIAADSAQPIDQGEEIKISDIHTRAKKFVNEVGIETINNIFYLENGNFKPLYDDLKSPKVSESQVRVALLEALKNGLKTGEFSFDTEAIREMCDSLYKCYDKANFAKNFKDNIKYFQGEYQKGSTMRLSSDGKDKLKEIVKEL